ncbi:ArsA family ATPase [Halodesulfurarchaeum formicicum]|uniref:Arsenite-transporting ATPase n=1 Tax=Halodesulfurarchaeum formicicum TaxID=1873524 RepID=A0A1J1ADE7_9EURY|nr:TRC40/GET3/ArsA family transport-energizing ATPase [Halodesulfurarchaeum formicicum]APE95917.1 arsenite-transporting ATPase [Halodesulfurarchaeum formicicum]
MDDIEVEAVDSLEPGVAGGTAEYVLYGGKGGVGKTTMAAATGLASALDGTDTLVVSTDPAHSLGDAYGVSIPSEPTRIREDIPLFAVEIDPETALQEVGAFGGDLSMGGVGDLLGGEEPDPLLDGQFPGADEAAAMQLLLEYLDDDRFDRIVIDTAPTGHTLRLLELPEMMETMMGRFVRLRDRLGSLGESLTGLFGESEGADGPDLDPQIERVERLRALLADPERTDFRIVTVPEEMAVEEAKRLENQLQGFGIPVSTVVVNRVMEPLESILDDVAPGEYVAPNLDDCQFCQRRWDVQQSALGTAQELFMGYDVKRVPLFAEEVRGEELLRLVAACLE